MRPEIQQAAAEKAWELGIQGLVVAGGDGSMRGALALHQLGYSVAGIPCSIDNDVPGTDMCIGTDTAINTALEAFDRIKDTASSHQRAMVVEVMGVRWGSGTGERYTGKDVFIRVSAFRELPKGGKS